MMLLFQKPVRYKDAAATDDASESWDLFKYHDAPNFSTFTKADPDEKK